MKISEARKHSAKVKPILSKSPLLKTGTAHHHDEIIQSELLHAERKTLLDDISSKTIEIEAMATRVKAIDGVLCVCGCGQLRIECSGEVTGIHNTQYRFLPHFVLLYLAFSFSLLLS